MSGPLQVVANQLDNARIERRQWNGSEYLVAPVVMLVAGVVNGELVPPDELALSVASWNGRPVTLDHPMLEGSYVSANLPEIFERDVVGSVFNAMFDGARLMGEVWVDVNKANRLGGDALTVVERLEHAVGTEVSTAYTRRPELRAGVYNGKQYRSVAHDLQPDHLALLLHELGACSWEDGCGVPRVNKDTGQDGVMVGFFLSPEDAAALALDGGEVPPGSEVTPAEEMHLTLAYLGTLDEVRTDELALLRLVGDYARWSPLVRGQVSGIGRFNSQEGDNRQALYASFDCGYLPEWREELVRWLEMETPIQRAHGFTPHITLAYVPADEATPLLPPAARELVFDRICVAWGGRRTYFALQGMGEQPALEMVGNAQAKRAELKANGCTCGEENSTMGANDVEQADAVTTEEQEAQQRTGDEAVQEANEEQAQQPPAQPTANANQTAQVPAEVTEVARLIQELGGVGAVRESLELLKTNRDESRRQLIQELTANQACAFTAAELEQMNSTQLTKLAQSLRVPSFEGRGGLRSNQGHDEWEEYAGPEPAAS